VLFSYLIGLFGSNEDIDMSSAENGDFENVESNGGSWLELLTAFHKPPEDGFHAETNQDDEGDVDGPEDASVVSSPRKERSRMAKATIRLSSDVIFRACYFLSNESLRVQISACESLTRGFHLLALCSKEVRCWGLTNRTSSLAHAPSFNFHVAGSR